MRSQLQAESQSDRAKDRLSGLEGEALEIELDKLIEEGWISAQAKRIYLEGR